jgi:hypothetical protein
MSMKRALAEMAALAVAFGGIAAGCQQQFELRLKPTV